MPESYRDYRNNKPPKKYTISELMKRARTLSGLTNRQVAQHRGVTDGASTQNFDNNNVGGKILIDILQKCGHSIEGVLPDGEKYILVNNK